MLLYLFRPGAGRGRGAGAFKRTSGYVLYDYWKLIVILYFFCLHIHIAKASNLSYAL